MDIKSDLIAKLHAALDALGYPFKHLDGAELDNPWYLLEILQSHLDTIENDVLNDFELMHPMK